MKHTFGLIDNRLKMLEAAITQHKYCIDNNINRDFYKDSLLHLEKELDELKEEYKLLKSIIKNIVLNFKK